MAICTICNHETDEYVNYTAYSQVKGCDRLYPVCKKCDKHFDHAAYIVEQEAIKFDREYGR